MSFWRIKHYFDL